MQTITHSDAQTLVRRNLDELDPNGSWMYGDENGSSADYGDNKSLDSLIARFLPEAINTVHMAAPIHMLEGTALSNESTVATNDHVVTITLPNTAAFLRLVALKVDDGILVTDAIPEASAEGRKQLNSVIRGTPDRPRLVMMQGNTYNPTFKYYSCAGDTGSVTLLQYIKEQKYAASPGSYSYSSQLLRNIIDCTTARVLEALGDQRAESFYQKALNFSI